MLRFLTAPFRNTYQVVTQTARRMSDSDAQILAGSLAFTTVISLVPLLAVSLSVFMAYGGLDSLFKKIEPFVLQNLIEASGAEFSRGLRRSIHRVHSGALGFWGVVGLLIASTKLFHDMEHAVQRVWQIQSRRSLIRRVIVYWLVMFLAPLIFAGALGILGSKDINLLAHLPKRALALCFVLVTFTAIYKYLPSRFVHFKSAFVSACFATAAIGVVQEFYVSFMKNILRVSRVYGSLASIPLFLLWLLVLWWICLAGVAMSAVLEERRK